MDKFHIELYPKADLENEWAKNKHTPGALSCMRCGGLMRESLAENALCRALNIYVCPACGMDEALRDAAGEGTSHKRMVRCEAAPFCGA